jgi:hypothetical protein
MINEWTDTKLIIVDEISFASASLLRDVNHALQFVTQKRENYGGISVLFSGDFCQLEPVGRDALYKETTLVEWHKWINTFVELKEGHRFDDEEYTELLLRLRGGTLNDWDMNSLDKRVIGKKNRLYLSDIPPNTQIACPTNRDRCAMNASTFVGHLQNTHEKNGPPMSHTLIIKASNLKWHSNKKALTKTATRTLYEKCSDCEVQRRDKKFVDPFMKLYLGAPIMLLDNIDVENGVANGTRCVVSKVVIKRGRSGNIKPVLLDGYNVNSIEASDIEHIVLHKQSDAEIKGMKIILTPENMTCDTDMPLEIYPGKVERHNVRISMFQFPMILNHATTVHKLQGQSVDRLYIVNWSYQQNWVYVALSRVRSIGGLYLRRKLARDRNFRPHSFLLKMIKEFQAKKPKEDIYE